MADGELRKRVLDEADRIYARRSAIDAFVSSRDLPLGIHQLVEFLEKSEVTLSPSQQRQLFADRGLRADFQRLKALRQTLAMPVLAAASDGQVTERRIDGGSIRLHPSRIADQYYVIIRFGSPSQYPRTLLLEAEAGEIVKRVLPEPDEGGELMFVCDIRQEADARFVALVRDPSTTGSFLA